MDHVLVSADRNLLSVLGVGFVILTVLQGLITAFRSWLVTWLNASVTVQWTSNVAAHMLRLPFSWFEKRHVGDIVSRMGSVQAIQRTLTTQLIGSLLDGVMSVITLIVMSLYSAPLAMLVVTIATLYAVLRFVFFGSLWRANESQIVVSARQQSELLETIRGVLPIKLANQQNTRLARYTNATIAAANREVAIQRLNIWFGLASQLLFGVSRIFLIWLAALSVLNGHFSAGALVAFAAYADQFTTRISGLVDKWVDFRMLNIHAARLADVVLNSTEPFDEDCWSDTPPHTGVEVRGVGFRYSEGEPWVLRNVNLQIAQGESIAIVGGSGCGKTTLAKIILGLLEPSEGEVLFGGIPINKLGQERYRSLVAAVMQDDQLFAGSIEENISFGSTTSRVERIRECARMAAVDEDISAMPMGYQTLVGDMGASLSGGQKQRVILARALFREPKLLVLDEATSHLDVARESQVKRCHIRAKNHPDHHCSPCRNGQERTTHISVRHIRERIDQPLFMLQSNRGVAT